MQLRSLVSALDPAGESTAMIRSAADTFADDPSVVAMEGWASANEVDLPRILEAMEACLQSVIRAFEVTQPVP